jgi:hypothetical protein
MAVGLVGRSKNIDDSSKGGPGGGTQTWGLENIFFPKKTSKYRRKLNVLKTFNTPRNAKKIFYFLKSDRNVLFGCPYLEIGEG